MHHHLLLLILLPFPGLAVVRQKRDDIYIIRPSSMLLAAMSSPLNGFDFNSFTLSILTISDSLDGDLPLACPETQSCLVTCPNVVKCLRLKHKGHGAVQYD
ncbi:hypothetical protein DPMN_068888 [Dreissena polymorpha]|uniref:Uncharacterized protein n=1 Tax=Dreissena polymorpha TaxID=45954 RepID=A0A9D3YY19_DREPO|nr:hypothetical protein DPMN_068888 [Dreissena polymorpha]